MYVCICTFILYGEREREREREREKTRRKEQIVTTEYINAVNIHVCARSYAQYKHTNGERER